MTSAERQRRYWERVLAKKGGVASLPDTPEQVRLRNENAKLKAELAGMRKAMKKIAKERDQFQKRAQPKFPRG
jgi:hypothetical protein